MILMLGVSGCGPGFVKLGEPHAHRNTKQSAHRVACDVLTGELGTLDVGSFSEYGH